ncbi:MAG: Enoyl-CoA hydratase/carnithine racemase [Frankiales bacterium]|jgi:enoyl-CoA hydratase|nr:Enoyl-CoA hydratase/carnithine racemase [Frankiales bacterium]
MSEEVLVERRGNVLLVTINRPDARNAVNRAVSEGISAALDELDESPELTLGIITGNGKTFCAGMDLKAFTAGEDPFLPGRGFGGITAGPPRKPMIAAVEGWALAGGCEIALACDLIVAADNARFGIPEVKLGLVAAAGGLLRLPHRIPPAIAMELALTGDPLSAAQAHAFGLVNTLTEPGGALAGAFALAERISGNAPLALAATKKILTESRDWPMSEAWANQSAIIDPVFASEDATEGASSFAEKRPPQWKGR